MTPVKSLHELMNQMVVRLDDILPDDLQARHEDKNWPFIEIYIQIDPLLAQLYKQYCDAKARLAALVGAHGGGDPMVDVARDMMDGAETAVATRLVELRQDKEAEGRAQDMIRAKQEALSRKKKQEEPVAVDHLMAFLLWTGMVVKAEQERHRVRSDFAHAA